MTPVRLGDAERSHDADRGYRWAFLLISYGLLGSTAYRSFVRNENSWDLLTLVIAAGLLATFYEARPKSPPEGRGILAVVVTLLAVFVAAAILVPAL